MYTVKLSLGDHLNVLGKLDYSLYVFYECWHHMGRIAVILLLSELMCGNTLLKNEEFHSLTCILAFPEAEPLCELILVFGGRECVS